MVQAQFGAAMRKPMIRKWPAVVLVMLIIAGAWMISRNTQPSNETTPVMKSPGVSESPRRPSSASPSVQEGVSGEEPTPVDSPSYEGSDDTSFTLSEETRQKALDTTSEFITAWLTKDTQERVRLLEPVTGQALLENLGEPTTKVWDTTPQGKPVIVKGTATGMFTQQKMSDGRSLDILLIYEPFAQHEWLVIEVAPTPKS